MNFFRPKLTLLPIHTPPVPNLPHSVLASELERIRVHVDDGWLI